MHYASFILINVHIIPIAWFRKKIIPEIPKAETGRLYSQILSFGA